MTLDPMDPMMRSTGRQIAPIVIAVALVLAPATAMASHNSIGAHVNVLEPDEVARASPDQGELRPDVPASTAPSFHSELDTSRASPLDQSGERYRLQGGCTTHESYGDQSTYEQGLRTGEACYVGFLDTQWEYMQFTQIFSVHRSEDLLYPVNPTPSDGYCNGRDDPEQPTGVGPVDQRLTALQRGGSDPACQPATHDQYVPGYIGVDTDLVETPIQGRPGAAPGAVAATGTQPASGTLTLPLFTTPYTFLFGQPHPDNPAPNPHRAGQGIFGPNPIAGGSPLTDLTGACGDRTDDCHLLEPFDLLHYDSYADELSAAGVEVGQTARLCLFTIPFTYEHPLPDTRLCGSNGRPMDLFLGRTQAGGLGIEGAPNTWLNTLPGWYRASVMAPLGDAGILAHAADAYAEDPAPASVDTSLQAQDYHLPTTDDTSRDHAAQIPQVTAVNPAVPLPGSGLDCLRPNMLAAGDGTSQIDATLDPGVYGAYRADAIDTDLYRSATRPQQQAAVGATHPIVRPLVALAEDTLPGNDGETEIPGVPDDVEAALAEASDRADPTARERAEDPGVVAFQREQPAGIACTPEGTLTVRETSTVLDGYLDADIRLQANTGNDDQIPSFPQPPGVPLKDPTADGGLPPASESERAPWRPDVYSFEGDLRAVLDRNTNGQLDPCAEDTETTPADLCTWGALWDAYNPACRGPDGQTTCGAILDRAGFDVDAGVGVYLVLEITGPLLLVDEDRRAPGALQDRTRIVGDANPTARNCIVATSLGFAPKLAAQVGTTVDELPDALCPDANGEHVLVEDGFDDQTADPARAGAVVERGDVSAAIQFIPLTPTPSAAEDTTTLGTDDRVCMTGVFPVQDDRIVEAGGAALTTDTVLSDCDPLSSS